MIRAKQTARIVNENRNIPIIYDKKISVRKFGEFKGKKQILILILIGFWNYKANIKYKEAENIQDFFKKSLYFFRLNNTKV